MGREKYIRSNHRKVRSVPSKSNGPDLSDPPAPSDAPDPPDFAAGNPRLNPNFDDSGWGYCTEDQLEELLLKNLEFIYQEAVSKLVSLGYDDDLALRSILRNGHWYGNLDVLSNILHNATAYIQNSASSANGDGNSSPDEPELGFSDLRQLQEYSLAGMVCLLQQLRPSLSRGDAMWCLLMSNLHLSRASAIEIPVVPAAPDAPADKFSAACGGGKVNPNEGFRGAELCDPAAAVNPGPPPAAALECPNRFDLAPPLKTTLKRNVGIFAAGFRANLRVPAQPPPPRRRSCGGGDGCASGLELDAESMDVLSSVMSDFKNMSIEERAEEEPGEQKNEVTSSLVRQVQELEGHVKERREWANQKAIQAAHKLANDLMELKLLRMEREETLRLKKGKQALEDTTMKKLSEMENALRKASGQVDRANVTVKRLEMENAEIKAEMEASKLSAEESVTACLEVAKREKRSLKKLLAWEKQKAKLQEEVAEEKQKIVQLQQQLLLVKEAQKDAEMKWRQEVKAKGQAIAQVEEERRTKEATEIRVKSRKEELHRKIERDIQRYKDDVQRLEQELSHLKASAESTRSNGQLHSTANGDTNVAKIQKEANAKNILDSHKQDSSRKVVNHDKECLICVKEEVSVVFLPCAHQVLCAGCNEDHEKEAENSCPCCHVAIEQRIRVYGASS